MFLWHNYNPMLIQMGFNIFFPGSMEFSCHVILLLAMVLDLRGEIHPNFETLVSSGNASAMLQKIFGAGATDETKLVPMPESTAKSAEGGRYRAFLKADPSLPPPPPGRGGFQPSSVLGASWQPFFSPETPPYSVPNFPLPFPYRIWKRNLRRSGHTSKCIS